MAIPFPRPRDRNTTCTIRFHCEQTLLGTTPKASRVHEHTTTGVGRSWKPSWLRTNYGYGAHGHACFSCRFRACMRMDRLVQRTLCNFFFCLSWTFLYQLRGQDPNPKYFESIRYHCKDRLFFCLSVCLFLDLENNRFHWNCKMEITFPSTLETPKYHLKCACIEQKHARTPETNYAPPSPCPLLCSRLPLHSAI